MDGNRTIAAVERQWEQQVGAERYRVFREVLLQLGDGSPGERTSDRGPRA